MQFLKYFNALWPLLIDLVICNVTYNYKTFYYEQPVDHFSFANKDTYQMRYLLNDDHWDQDGGPILFYCGNEGDIEMFSNNTGFMYEIAPEFKAMVVFAEHRYYGISMPYGKDSYKDLDHVGYLSSEQALADYARFLTFLRKSKPGAENSAVITFGGSYGGMLATWFRMKYPNVVQGSLAASAPIWMFGDLTPCNTFFKIVTADFKSAAPHCADNVRRSWDVINSWAKTAEGLAKLSSTFKLCISLSNTSQVGDFKGWLTNTYGNLAMVDYPYAASFLEPLPAWPIKAVCAHLTAASPTDEQLMTSLAAAVGVYYNYTGDKTCLDTGSQALPSLGDMGWDFQACSEMVMPMCTDGVWDMFEPSPYNATAFAEGCQKQWGVTPRPEWPIVQYAGKDLSHTSNIIFSNGGLDPWSGGGVLMDLSPSLVAIFIPEGAHHLDLRAAHPDDPASVIEARKREKGIIKGWIDEYKVQLSQGSSRMWANSAIGFTWISAQNDSIQNLPSIVLIPVASLLIVVLFVAVVVRIRRGLHPLVVVYRREVGDKPVAALIGEKQPLI